MLLIVLLLSGLENPNHTPAFQNSEIGSGITSISEALFSFGFPLEPEQCPFTYVRGLWQQLLNPYGAGLYDISSWLMVLCIRPTRGWGSVVPFGLFNIPSFQQQFCHGRFSPKLLLDLTKERRRGTMLVTGTERMKTSRNVEYHTKSREIWTRERSRLKWIPVLSNIPVKGSVNKNTHTQQRLIEGLFAFDSSSLRPEHRKIKSVCRLAVAISAQV